MIRRLGLAGWTVDLFRRATLLVDTAGNIAAAWAEVPIRGHAAAVLDAARALGPAPASAEGPSAPSA